MGAKKTIAVDLDEVLGSFVQPLCSFHNEAYGTHLKLSDFFSYSFADVWGGSQEQSTEKVFRFFDSPHFADIPVIPGAQAGVARLKQAGHELVIVTSRQHAIESQTRQWVRRHYPGVFREIAFGNHWGKDGKKISKRELCEALNASALIDDNVGYVKEVSASGMRAVLFDLDGKYMWNKATSGQEDSEGVIRVTNWDEAVEALLKE